MRKITFLYLLFVAGLFSVAILTHAFAGVEGSDITGFVVSTAENIDMPSGEICVDDDEGRAYKRGVTSVFTSEAVDYCLDDTRLVEYSCVTLFRTEEVITCPFGCRDGACV